MDQAADFLLQKGTLLLGVLVVITTFFIRLVVETALPQWRKKADENSPAITYATPLARWWNSVILYTLPVVIGGLLATWKGSWFLPAEAVRSDALLFGIIIGWFSSFMYKVVRKVLKSRTGIDPVPGPVSLTPPDGSEED